MFRWRRERIQQRLLRRPILKDAFLEQVGTLERHDRLARYRRDQDHITIRPASQVATTVEHTIEATPITVGKAAAMTVGFGQLIRLCWQVSIRDR